MAIRFKVQFPSWLNRLVLFALTLYHSIRLRCPVRIIPLTKGKFAIVDPDDYHWLSKYNWHVVTTNGFYYAARRARVSECRSRGTVFMNREVLKPPRNLLADHRNHHTLDNRKSNLRPATYVENGRNRRKVTKRNKSSKYKGVSFHKSKKRWRAVISYQGRSIQLGEFKTELEAAKAYDKAAKFHFGEFACLNLPHEGHPNLPGSPRAGGDPDKCYMFSLPARRLLIPLFHLIAKLFSLYRRLL